MALRPAQAAAYQAIVTRCSGTGEPWGGRVHLRRAPVGTARPYVVFFLSGGGARNDILDKRDANLLITVRVGSNNLSEALAGAGRLAELLDNAGRFDVSDNPLNGGDDWLIQTSTAEDDISFDELVDGAPVYHEGFQLRLIMEEA